MTKDKYILKVDDFPYDENEEPKMEHDLYLDCSSLQNLSRAIHKIAVEKGFWEGDVRNRNVGEMLALIHSEVSEALEAHRTDAMSDKLPGYSGLEEELADALIRILDMSEGLGINLAMAVMDKIEYNKTRPYKHGKAY